MAHSASTPGGPRFAYLHCASFCLLSREGPPCLSIKPRFGHDGIAEWPLSLVGVRFLDCKIINFDAEFLQKLCDGFVPSMIVSNSFNYIITNLLDYDELCLIGGFRKTSWNFGTINVSRKSSLDL